MPHSPQLHPSAPCWCHHSSAHLVVHAQHCTPGREGTGLHRRHSDAAPCRIAAGTDLYGYGGCTEPHSAGVRTGPCHPMVTSRIRTVVAEILFGAELRQDRNLPQLHADGSLSRGAMPTPKQRRTTLTSHSSVSTSAHPHSELHSAGCVSEGWLPLLITGPVERLQWPLSESCSLG